MTIRHVAVVVPAADEQDTIAQCLRSIADARAHLVARRPEITVEVTVVLDGCRDATSRVVSGVGGARVVVTDRRVVGAARQLGSQHAVCSSGVARRHVWLSHTDADSLVPGDWLTRHVAHAESGAVMVLGTVVPDLVEPALSRWRHRHDAADGHPHIHGANLGVRADTLHRLGGWPVLTTGEDVALVRRATAQHAVIARIGDLAVTTSARREGRAPHGFSSYLRRLDDGPPTVSVDGPA